MKTETKTAAIEAVEKTFRCLKAGVRTWALAGSLVAGAGAADFGFQAVTKPTGWMINYRGQRVMEYAFVPGTYKSYVKALYTLGGENVLRDSPFDHLHHHALMYGIVVNGINFWEEIAGAGVQKTVQISEPQSEAGQTRITQSLYWLAPQDAFLPNTNAPALLIEQRTLILHVDPERKEVALRWNSKFELGTKTNTVVLTGANYHGLGMRFRQDFDASANHFYSEGKPDLSANQQDVTSHDWEAITFSDGGNPITLALFGHPQNVRGKAHFFSMRTPFAYISATQRLDKEPLVYKKGDKFELNYLVTVYPEKVSPAALSERAQQWQHTLQ